MDKIDKIIRDRLAKNKSLGAYQSAQICFLADKWGNGRFKAVSFQKGVLKVSVGSSSAASELKMQEDELIDSINSSMGKKIIRSLRILIFG